MANYSGGKLAFEEEKFTDILERSMDARRLWTEMVEANRDRLYVRSSDLSESMDLCDVGDEGKSALDVR